MFGCGQRRLGVRGAIAVYAVAMVLPLAVANKVMERRVEKAMQHPMAGENLPAKMRYYQAHTGDYDLVLIGDSRTYINLQPWVIDAALGTHTANLGMWGHYFATQYSQLSDIVDHFPKNATLLWSIGHRNFQPVDELVWKDFNPPAQRTPFNTEGRWFIDRYPVHIENAPNLLWWGYPWHAVKRNLIRFGPFGELLEKTRDWRYTMNRRRNNPVAVISLGGESRVAAAAPPTPPVTTVPAAPAPPPELSEDALLEIQRRWIPDEEAGDRLIMRDDGHVTSIVVYTRQGSYYRIETDPAYFRAKQRELAESIQKERKPAAEITSPYAPSPPFWKNFLAILDLLKTHGIHVVVNELEEAPFIYAAWGGESEMRKFLDEQVVPAVRARGFPYIRADFSAIRDEHYFDMDHFNSEGVRAYTPLLAEALRPYLAKKE